SPLVLLLSPLASHRSPRLPRLLRHGVQKGRIPRKRVLDRGPDPALAPRPHGLLVEQSLLPLREGPEQLPASPPGNTVVAFPRLRSSHPRPVAAVPRVTGLLDPRLRSQAAQRRGLEWCRCRGGDSVGLRRLLALRVASG